MNKYNLSTLMSIGALVNYNVALGCDMIEESNINDFMRLVNRLECIPTGKPEQAEEGQEEIILPKLINDNVDSFIANVYVALGKPEPKRKTSIETAHMKGDISLSEVVDRCIALCKAKDSKLKATLLNSYPSPKNDKAPSPENDKAPSPKNDKAPSPKNDKAPSPPNTQSKELKEAITAFNVKLKVFQSSNSELFPEIHKTIVEFVGESNVIEDLDMDDLTTLGGIVDDRISELKASAVPKEQEEGDKDSRMTDKAEYSYDAYIDAGWLDETLVEAGLMS